MTRRLGAIAVIASREGCRRISQTLTQELLFETSLAGLGQLIRSERPEILILEIHAHWRSSDTDFARNVLRSLADNERKRIRVILYISSPRVLFHAGDLLFSDASSMEPSGCIDAFVIAPPFQRNTAVSAEQQLSTCIELLSEALIQTDIHLPALGDPHWAPTLAGPESLSLWFRWLPRYARYQNENPLILGETGTGKTRLAAAIHTLSERTGPFVSITPRDFSSAELVQAELFGAVAGAYTGAVDKWGLVRRAENGTLFIDELQSIDVELQGKLITFIEDKKYRRVGAAEQHSANVRFIFASNRSLQELVSSERLRDDFAYRLERLPLHLLPLRERPLDIAAGICRSLAEIHRVRPEQALLVEGLTEEAYRTLFAARWPGNIRQLENVVARCVETTLLRGGRLIAEEDVIAALSTSLGGYAARAEEVLARALEYALVEVRANSTLSAQHVSTLVLCKAREFALESCSGDSTRAAALLGEDEQILNWIEQLRL